jgi:hypothetical protein
MHRRQPVAREELTEVFWPGSSPPLARNNLNVSIWGLRNRLREPLGGRSVCVFGDGAYRLDPALMIHVDAEELERLAAAAQVRRRAGDVEGAAADLRAAVALYAGDLFEADRYEAWIDPFRRNLADIHIATITDLAECERRLGDIGTPSASAVGVSPWSPSARTFRRAPRRWRSSSGFAEAAAQGGGSRHGARRSGAGEIGPRFPQDCRTLARSSSKKPGTMRLSGSSTVSFNNNARDDALQNAQPFVELMSAARWGHWTSVRLPPADARSAAERRSGPCCTVPDLSNTVGMRRAWGEKGEACDS